jgi:hypothetical protein
MRDRGDQAARIGVLRPVEDIFCRTLLDDQAALHHGDAVGDVGDHSEIMGDEHHAHALGPLDLADQVEDLGLGGDVERRRRLVGDQQRRLERQRHGDHHALALPAGQAERIGVAQVRGVGKADILEQFEHAPFTGRRVLLAMDFENFGDLVSDLHQRVQCRKRLLEHHRHGPAALGLKLRLAHVQQIPAAKQDPPGARLQVSRQEPHDRVGGQGFAGAGFADDAQDLAGLEVEGDLLDGEGAVEPGRQRNRQVLDAQEGGGSVRHLSPSARADADSSRR